MQLVQGDEASIMRRLMSGADNPLPPQGEVSKRPLLLAVPPLPPHPITIKGGEEVTADMFRRDILGNATHCISVMRSANPDDFPKQENKTPSVGMYSETFSEFLSHATPRVTPRWGDKLYVRHFTCPDGEWDQDDLFEEIHKRHSPFISFASLYFALLPQAKGGEGELPTDRNVRFYVDIGNVWWVTASKLGPRWFLHAESLHANKWLHKKEVVVSH
jgi:hypothetical protein